MEEAAAEVLKASTEAPRTVIMTTIPSVERTAAQKQAVRQMEPRISQFVAGHLQDRVFLDRFRSSRAKIVPEATKMTPALAREIMQNMGIKFESDEVYLQAYDIMGVTENFSAIWKEKPPPEAEQKRLIQQRVNILANYSYDSNLSEKENMERLDRILSVLK